MGLCANKLAAAVYPSVHQNCSVALAVLAVLDVLCTKQATSLDGASSLQLAACRLELWSLEQLPFFFPLLFPWIIRNIKQGQPT